MHYLRAVQIVVDDEQEVRDVVAEILAAQGHEVASHGMSHRLVYDMTPTAFREDVRRSKAVLEAAGGAAVLGKGQLGFGAAYVQGLPSWSPPI